MIARLSAGAYFHHQQTARYNRVADDEVFQEELITQCTASLELLCLKSDASCLLKYPPEIVAEVRVCSGIVFVPDITWKT